MALPPGTSRLIGKLASWGLARGRAVAEDKARNRLGEAGFSPARVDRMLSGKGFVRQTAAVAAARIASRSIPGALLVGAGFLARSLLIRPDKPAAAPQGEENPAPSPNGLD